MTNKNESQKTCPKCGGEGEFVKSWYIKGKHDTKMKTKIKLFRCKVCHRLFRKGERVKTE